VAQEIARGFLHHYEALTGRHYDRWWDLEYLLDETANHWTPENVAFAEALMGAVCARVGA